MIILFATFSADLPAVESFVGNMYYHGLALQLTASGKHERFVIFSVETGKPVAEVNPEQDGEQQSWTAFSPDGSMFVVGSPLKLALYRLPLKQSAAKSTGDFTHQQQQSTFQAELV